MTKFTRFSLLLFLCCSTNWLHAEIKFFLSPDGNDQWSGRYAIPTADGTDGPLQTLAHAQDVVRSAIGDRVSLAEPITIYLRGGEYRLESPLEFTEQDSGTAIAPITWRAYPGEQVLLQGARNIKGWIPAVEASPDKRIRAGIIDHIWAVNLRSMGIEDFGQMRRKGTGVRPDHPGPLQVFQKDQPLTLARYPNDEWLKIESVPQLEGEPFFEAIVEDYRNDGYKSGRHFGEFCYPGDRPRDWQDLSDVWINGYFTWDWANSYEPVAGFRFDEHIIECTAPYHRFGYTKGQRFYFLNILEELDTPGEWFLDRKTGWLYLWPEEDGVPQNIRVSMLETPLVSMRGVEHLTLADMEIAYGRAQGVAVAGGTAVMIDNCRFHSLGLAAIDLAGGNDHTVANCEIYNVDAGGITMDAGDRRTLTPANHLIFNNDIHHYGRIYRTQRPAISLRGVGNRIVHNAIHDAPHVGLRFWGNDHVIEFNEVYRTAQETGDVGAIYSGREYASRGTIIRYNYLHDLEGPGLHGVRGVYLDDFKSGIIVHGNVFLRAGRAAFIGGGRSNVISGNVFLNCEPSIQVDARGLSWSIRNFDTNHPIYDPGLRNNLAAFHPDQPPYSLRYPKLASVFDDDANIPKYNRLEGNVSAGGIFLDLYDGVDLNLVTARDNWTADPVLLRMSEGTDQVKELDVYANNDPAGREKLRGNLIVPPEQLVNSNDDRAAIHALMDAARDAGIGFIPPPFDQMGLLQESHKSRKDTEGQRH